MTAGLEAHRRRNGVRNWRVTIERADGTFYVRDEMAASPRDAKTATLTAYRAKYSDEPVDGFTHWIKRCVEVAR